MCREGPGSSRAWAADGQQPVSVTTGELPSRPWRIVTADAATDGYWPGVSHPSSPVLNTTQFLVGRPGTDLARRNQGVKIPSPPPPHTSRSERRRSGTGGALVVPGPPGTALEPHSRRPSQSLVASSCTRIANSVHPATPYIQRPHGLASRRRGTPADTVTTGSASAEADEAHRRSQGLVVVRRAGMGLRLYQCGGR